jgi:hypothetical protein
MGNYQLIQMKGSKFWSMVAASKWYSQIYGEGTLLRNLIKMSIAEGLDSDIVEASAAALANLSAHGMYLSFFNILTIPLC